MTEVAPIPGSANTKAPSEHQADQGPQDDKSAPVTKGMAEVKDDVS